MGEILPSEAVCGIAESLPDDNGVTRWRCLAARGRAGTIRSGLVIGRLYA